MRIVAGTHRSRKIETLAGEMTRPTADRIKEAVFSRVGPYFYGGKMLDCYAGSGSIGFEALSRGMDAVDAFEISKEACQIIKKNCTNFKMNDRYTLHETSIFSGIDSLNETYDFIYLDPPYAKQQNEMLIQKISDLNLLSEEGCLVVESLKDDHFSEKIGCFECVKTANYGITKISYYERERK